MNAFQQTIKKTVEFSGVGLFSGKPVSLRLNPAPIDTGIRFVRSDLSGNPCVLAHAKSIANDTRRVLLKNNGTEVEGIEHMMACLAGLGVDNLEIEINEKEMPAGDGSSIKFVQLIKEAELVEQDAKKKLLVGKDIVVVSDGKASISIIPDSEELKVSYTLDFDGYCLNDKYSINVTTSSFCEQLAPARTFGFDTNINTFKELGIGKGITDDNTFVVHKNGDFSRPLSMSPAELRFPDECVRHKILDLLGDLYLSNITLSGHIIAKRSGHFLNIRMARKLAEMADNI
ncbi:MAG: UDP-3-O-acyl-N-acetylglucosamine deacetylase [Candidatus Anammoxibacter sp.]